MISLIGYPYAPLKFLKERIVVQGLQLKSTIRMIWAFYFFPGCFRTSELGGLNLFGFCHIRGSTGRNQNEVILGEERDTW